MRTRSFAREGLTFGLTFSQCSGKETSLRIEGMNRQSRDDGTIGNAHRKNKEVIKAPGPRALQSREAEAGVPSTLEGGTFQELPQSWGLGCNVPP